MCYLFLFIIKLPKVRWPAQRANVNVVVAMAMLLQRLNTLLVKQVSTAEDTNWTWLMGGVFLVKINKTDRTVGHCMFFSFPVHSIPVLKWCRFSSCAFKYPTSVYYVLWQLLGQQLCTLILQLYLIAFRALSIALSHSANTCSAPPLCFEQELTIVAVSSSRRCSKCLRLRIGCFGGDILW